MRRSTIAALLALPVAAAVWAMGSTDNPGTPAPAIPLSQSQITLSFAPVVQATAPAVVNIFTTTLVQRPSPFADDPFFQQLFQGAGRPQLQNALGSGVVVGADGLVLTNNHVIDGATQIRVVLHDRREYPAQVLLADPDLDLAVLRLTGAQDLPALKLDDSDALHVGDLVLAIGNPFGVGQTVSSGIVSGLARSALQVGNGRGYFIQTDAPINPGNSGGALVDMAGGLIGLNTAILTQGGGSEGIGFAIPSNIAAAFLAQARAGATRFVRPWAGMTAQEIDAAMADSLGLPLPEGIIVTRLARQSPFAAAGLAEGDVILTLGGAPVNTPQEMNYRLAILGQGARVQVAWLHDGQPAEAQVTLAPPPEDPPRDTLTVTENVILRGATLSRINPAVAAEMNLPPDAAGVVVVSADDYAARIGLQPGDILQAINRVAIDTPQAALKATRQRIGLWQFDLIRHGQPLRLRFRL